MQGIKVLCEERFKEKRREGLKIVRAASQTSGRLGPQASINTGSNIDQEEADEASVEEAGVTLAISEKKV